MRYGGFPGQMLGLAKKLRQEFESEALPHIDALYGTALRLTRNPRDAEDLVQDAMLLAYRFFHRFERGSNCRAWLFKILTNTFINTYHRDRRDREVTAALAAEEAVTQDIVNAEASHSLRDPEGALASRLLSEDVQRALETVPTEFRLAVLLCDVEGFSYKEIADIMECPVGTVMSRLHRGRKLLREKLRDYSVERGVFEAPKEEIQPGEACNGKS